MHLGEKEIILERKESFIYGRIIFEKIDREKLDDIKRFFNSKDGTIINNLARVKTTGIEIDTERVKPKKVKSEIKSLYSFLKKTKVKDMNIHITCDNPGRKKNVIYRLSDNKVISEYENGKPVYPVKAISLLILSSLIVGLIISLYFLFYKQ